MSEKIDVEVRTGVFSVRGIRAKRGDKISIPLDESEQSAGIKAGLKSGRLKRIEATMDLTPAPSQEFTEEVEKLKADVETLTEENETLKKANAGLKGALTKSKRN